MSEALPENAQGPIDPEPEARPPVSPPMQSISPAWEDPDAQTTISESSAFEAGVPKVTHGFTLERGGRNAMADTAERIGSAVGNAQRQVRRGLELVRRPATQIAETSSTVAADAAERANEMAHEGANRAARAIDEMKNELYDSRQQAARRPDEWSAEAGERFQQLRRQTRQALADSRERIQELADRYPLQTIAAVAGFCLIFGATLRFRRSHRG